MALGKHVLGMMCVLIGQEDPWSPDDRFGVVLGGRLIDAWIPNWKSRIFGPTNFRSDLWCFYTPLTPVSRICVNVLYTSLVYVQACVVGSRGGGYQEHLPQANVLMVYVSLCMHCSL